MLRTEASFSSLKDGYVFRASLELHLSQGNVHKQNRVFQKMHKDNKFLSPKERNEHWKEEKEKKMKKEKLQLYCTRVSLRLFQLLRNLDVSFLSSGCIMEHYGKGCYSARRWMEMLPHHFLLGPSSWGSHSESWTGVSYSVFLSRRC